MTAGLQLGLSRAAHAASSESTEETLQTIIVTSTRVSENVQTVPMSITPLTADVLERAGVVDFNDYAHMVPNLTFSYGFGVQGADVAIRGIQGAGTTAFYIDDLPVDQLLDPKLLNNVARIEVLRGPQGTLYGARSMGGAVRTITELPDTHKMSGGVDVQGTQYSGGRPGYQVDGYWNVPLIADKLALRISLFDGSAGPFIQRQWLTNPDNPALANSNLSPSALAQFPLTGTLTARNDYYGGMASLLWQATDNLSVRATYMKQVNNWNGWPLSDFEVPPTPPGVQYTGPYTANSLSQTRTFDIPEYDYLTWWLGGLTLEYQTSIGMLSSATGYTENWSNNYEDVTEWLHNVVFPGLPPLPSPIFSWNYSHTFVEELRFASKPLGPFQFVTGIYIFRQNGNPGQNWVIPGSNAYSGGTFGTDVGYYANGQSQDHENAAYVNLTYHFTEKFSATGGDRYSQVKTENIFPWSGWIVAPTTGGGGSTDENVSTPSFSLQYQQSPNIMYYALASKGFRPGDGQVAPPPSQCGADYARTGLTPEQLSLYGADYLWNYEVGAKTETFDNRLKVNVSAYQIDWKNIQQDSRFTSCGFTFTVNAGAARSRGGELELAIAPARGLQLSAGVGYTDAKITESSPTLAQSVGAPIQQVAPWTANAAADYTFPLTNIWNGIFHFDYSYTDRSFSANNNAQNLRMRPSYQLVNIRGGMQSASWQMEAFIENASNAHPNLADSASEAGEDPGRPRIRTLAPRTYGLQVGYRF
jgi:outer membrane receptor protein involved in Fe transport